MLEITESTIQTAELARRLENPASGGFVTFEGWVRDTNDGRNVLRLEYEVYTPIAVSEGRQVINEALSNFDITAALCQHREGLLEIGECAVWVGVTAAHRDAAFQACRYIIDNVKTRLPIWKKEYYAEGDSGWVNCENCASHAAAT